MTQPIPDGLEPAQPQPQTDSGHLLPPEKWTAVETERTRIVAGR